MSEEITHSEEDPDQSVELAKLAADSIKSLKSQEK
jgi:hypothetical protein